MSIEELYRMHVITLCWCR